MDSFPRQYARTQQFRLGEPRSFTVSPDGARVLFLRSPAGDDPVQRLWVCEVATGAERCLADPLRMGVWEADLPPHERARRERVRESAAGIVAYAADRAVSAAVFTLGGQLWYCDVETGRVRAVAAGGRVVDPRLDPAGVRIAYVQDEALWIVAPTGTPRRLLADEGVSWGLAEFVASEEMGRTRGHWWSPDSQRLAVARVDTSGVTQWHIARSEEPSSPPQPVRYPAAGTANAEVRLFVADLDGDRVEVEWDRAGFEYLAHAGWSAAGGLTLVVQSRDQRTLRVLTASPESGATKVVAEQADAHWVDLIGGVPCWLDDHRLVTTVVEADTCRVAVDGVAVSPPGLHVRRVVYAGADGIVVVASGEDPTAVAVWRVPLRGEPPVALSPTGGVCDAAGGEGGLVVLARGLDQPGAATTVRSAQGTAAIRSCPQRPLLRPRVTLRQLGRRRLCAALLLPQAWTPQDGPLPVLLDPYGGPHAQRVLRSHNAFLSAQWFADAGFAVLIADGRGTPGRGHDWERAVAGDLAGPPLEDQVDALEAAVQQRPDALDPARVGIRGWSFGGFLAALAVLRRPDVFHAAVAGAPVTEWALYDTHYTERYLGQPQSAPEAYRRSSLLDDAHRLARPLLLIHGLADDNVVAAHTLRLSRALLESGRPHTVLPLSGVTHMTPQETVAENLLRLQLDFLQQALSGPQPPPPTRPRQPPPPTHP